MTELTLSLGKCQDLTGRRFGRLTVLSFVGKTATQQTKWQCRCDCGQTRDVWGSALRHGRTISCGCAKRQHLIAMRTRHGRCGTPEHDAWRNMIARCYNANAAEFHNYGGRGISVCERWRGERGFANFFADMGRKPTARHSLDRFPDVNGHYEPGNCRWATNNEQARNKRTNHLLTHDEVTLTVTDWAAKLGVHPRSLFTRLRLGWEVSKAITTPFGPPKRKKRSVA